MKADIKNELKDSLNAISILDSTIEDCVEFYLYNNDLLRNLIKIKKNNKTNSKYPRKFNEIKKKPL